MILMLPNQVLLWSHSQIKKYFYYPNELSTMWNSKILILKGKNS